MKKYLAEVFGTFWLVFGGCGSAVLAANVAPGTGIGLLGVSLAFGLTVLTMAYAVGHISGGHFNPAVSFGLWAGKRFDGANLIPYILSQLVGAVLAGAALYCVASGKPDFQMGAFAANGYGAASPTHYSLTAALVAEVLLTGFFVFIIMGATSEGAPKGFAPIAIGLALTLIHLISIPVTNTSVNPARSTGPALFVGGENLEQLWFFWLAPIAGAVIGAVVHRFISGDEDTDEVEIS